MAASRLEFRILGPLAVRVDGTSVPIGGPKQRALLALLLLSANRVVSRERLIGELFAEQSVNSADHALRNHVSRLRKVLAPATGGEPRLVARAPGYLLRVEPGELDLEHFERLVAAGRESLAAGDPAAAAESLRAAERLWRGRPLADLELEPFARVEVERLEELRLAAVEERIDADLSLGRQLALVSELEALGAEHPFRERFRAQLMLALYRCGRQAEGLEVYRRTRTLLSDELGLEPSVGLQELERAILVQDPALNVAADARGKAALPLREVCPFKGLAPFEAADAEFFFGRERLVDELVGRLADVPVLAIIGPSGSGKSSLLRAGLLPALGWKCVLLRPGEHQPAALLAGLESVLPGERLVLAVDQFEELFAASLAEQERRAFVDALVEAAWDPERRALIVIALRADFFGRLARYVELADLVGPNHVLLGAMSPTELRRAIEGPAERTGLRVEPALVDALVDDVAGEAGGLPLLSTALLDLWREREQGMLTFAAYERADGVRGAVGRHAEAAFRSLGPDDQKVARRILLRLVEGGDGEALRRRRATLEELDADDDERVARVLAALVERRLLVAGNGTAELVHEALLEQWPRLADWLDEDAQGHRLHRHLTHAATGWDAGGREPSELYRGARLAATLEWADAAGADAGLNRLERKFLEESRTAFARENRRLRALLAVAVLLLVAALVAGVLALVARGSASRQATAAIAQRLGAQALVDPQLDRAFLLARVGADLDDTAATRSNLLATLLRSPTAIAVAQANAAGVLDDALSPDGRLLAARGGDGRVAFFDPGTLRTIGPSYRGIGQITAFGAVREPFDALAFSPDGSTVAVGDSDGRSATLTAVDARTHRPRYTVTDKPDAVTEDVVFSAGGETIVSGDGVSGAGGPPDLVLVTRRASDGVELRRSKAIRAGRLVGFTRDGRDLLVTSGQRRTYLLQAGTLARVRSFGISGAVTALSPATDMAAFGEDDGSIRLLDLRTGSVRALERRATGAVVAIAFSKDGRALATGAADGSIGIWNAPSGTPRETFTGHAAAARGLRFSADGRTLYTGSSDGSITAWDVRGTRRLGRPFHFAPRPAGGQSGEAPTHGASTAVAVSPDSSRFVTSPGPNRVTLWRARDLTVLGELRGPCGEVVSLAWSHDGRMVAASGGGETIVWDVATRRIFRVLGPKYTHNPGVNFSPDDRLVGTAGAGRDGSLRLYDLRTARVLKTFRVRGTLQDVDFSSDGRRVATAGLAGDILVVDLRTLTRERTIHDNQLIFAIRFSPDGRRIATGGSLGNADIWDAVTGRHLLSLGGQNEGTYSVTFAPSGTQLMTTTGDGNFRVWDLTSRKLVGAPLPGPSPNGWGTYFPDGTRVIAAFDSGIGVVWDVDPAVWKAQACRVAHRNLTHAEWHDFLPERGYHTVCP